MFTRFSIRSTTVYTPDLHPTTSTLFSTRFFFQLRFHSFRLIFFFPLIFILFRFSDPILLQLLYFIIILLFLLLLFMYLILYICPFKRILWQVDNFVRSVISTYPMAISKWTILFFFNIINRYFEKMFRMKWPENVLTKL